LGNKTLNVSKVDAIANSFAMAMSILTCGILLSTFTLSCAEAFAAVAGYTPVTNISEFLAIGSAIKAVDTAVSFSESKEADWALATTEYEKEQGVALSLRKITTPPAGGDDRFNIFCILR